MALFKSLGRVIDSQNADVKEMECAAIAWVCDRYKIPFVALKSITDLVDDCEKVPEEFLKNFDQAVSKLATRVSEFVELLSIEQAR